MNYILGREADLEVRRHLARCSRCGKRMRKLEDAMIDAAREREAESANFGLQKG